MTPVLKTSRRLLILNLVRHTFPTKAVPENDRDEVCEKKKVFALLIQPKCKIEIKYLNFLYLFFFDTLTLIFCMGIVFHYENVGLN